MKFIVSILSLFYLCNASAQTWNKCISVKQLVGSWQEGSSQISSGLHKNFRFYPNGKFVLNYSDYDEVGRIRSVGGHYKLKDTFLFLTIEYRKERIGGKLERGSPGFQLQEFVFAGGKEVIIKQQDKESDEPCDISICKTDENDVICIQIDNNTYYKLSSNPDKAD